MWHLFTMYSPHIQHEMKTFSTVENGKYKTEVEITKAKKKRNYLLIKSLNKKLFYKSDNFISSCSVTVISCTLFLAAQQGKKTEKA
jgi:hypothetical protein